MEDHCTPFFPAPSLDPQRLVRPHTAHFVAAYMDSRAPEGSEAEEMFTMWPLSRSYMAEGKPDV
jgi:hypothetical protein